MCESCGLEVVVRLTPKAIRELELLDAIAAKWGLEPMALHVNPFRLAAARDEARKAGITLLDVGGDDGVTEEEAQ